MARSVSFLLSILYAAVMLICMASANRRLPENSPWEAVFETIPDDHKAAPNHTAQEDRGNYTKVCDPERYKKMKLDMKVFQFCNKHLPFDVRAKDLVDRMTLEEKVQQLGDTRIGVPRLGLPRYEWWSEALHGVSNVGQPGGPATYFDSVVPGATSFPTVILSTASFNESLWRRIGEVVSTEARAMRNLGHAGLTFWSPNVNVVRDPRWGRITETPGEDPLVVGRYAVNYVRGLQDIPGTDVSKNLKFRPLKVSACCKHYAAYDIEKWHGGDYYNYNAKVSEQDIVETFFRPFEMCVKDGDVSSIMCSYIKVNGIPACADSWLLKDVIRGEWGLNGNIVSDCDSIKAIQQDHFLNDSAEDSVAQALKAGLDLDCGTYYTKYGEGAVKQGKVREMDLDAALTNSYVVLFRLGFFDGNPSFDSLGKKDICSPQSLELAAEGARQGIVLLKNTKSALPLDPHKIKNIALVGPHGNATNVMIGNYAGVPCRYTSPLAAFGAYGKVKYQAGCRGVACVKSDLIPPAVEAAKHADATIIITGLDLSIEAEGLDRENLLLPGFQTEMINQVANASKGPVILVMMTAGPVDINFAKINPKVSAILWAGYPGEEGGTAIADIIFGKANPGGRLPVTWYFNDYVGKLPMTSMLFRPVDSAGYPGRTYRFYNGSVVYPFGFGLSYTTFKYTLKSADKSIDLKLKPLQRCRDVSYLPGVLKPQCASLGVDDMDCHETFRFNVDVQNTGKMAGSEAVLVYARPPIGVAGAPVKKLIAFKRVSLAQGRKQTVSFELNVCQHLVVVDVGARLVIPTGLHTIFIGDTMSFQIPVNVPEKLPLSADETTSSISKASKVKKPMSVEL